MNSEDSDADRDRFVSMPPLQPAAEIRARRCRMLPCRSPVTAPAPMAFLKSGKPMTVSVAQLRAENRRKELMWKGLIIASSGAATFDAWSTRHAITTAGAQELNPLLRPFAGNASLYAAIQVGPAADGFRRQENDVQQALVGAPHVVGPAERQLRQFHVLRRAQSGLSLDRGSP